MNLDLIIIRLLLYNDIFEKYISFVDEKHLRTHNREIYQLLGSIKALKEEQKGRDHSVDEFLLYFFGKYPVLQGAQKEIYETLIQDMRDVEVDKENAASFFQSLLDRINGEKVAECILNGESSLADALELLQSAVHERKMTDQIDFVPDSLDDLQANIDLTGGLSWRLKCLNESVGKLRKSNFVAIFAPPEVGKTAFICSETSEMIKGLQDGKKAIYFLNEEAGFNIKLRLYQSYFQVDRHTLMANKAMYNERIREEITPRVLMYDAAGVSRSEVEKICKEVDPGLIVVDNMDKIHGFFGDRPDLKFKSIYQWGRELSKTYAPVIAVSQACGEGINKLFLDIEDMDSTRVAKQGECDVIIGIGKREDKSENIRGISVVKNKLGWDDFCVGGMRHCKRQTIIIPEESRYEDL